MIFSEAFRNTGLLRWSWRNGSKVAVCGKHGPQFTHISNAFSLNKFSEEIMQYSFSFIKMTHMRNYQSMISLRENLGKFVVTISLMKWSIIVQTIDYSNASTRVHHPRPSPKNCPFPWQDPCLHLWFLGRLWVHTPNSTLIGSAVFAGLTDTSCRQTDRQADEQTDHATTRVLCSNRPHLMLCAVM